ncbi:MAG TPA: RT0821/Lpp0805 family surface protein [Rhizobiaceae bacterium]|nr:RT0821/Lpp0805 family surface protein [Rhizobiaceae bacterium]
MSREAQGPAQTDRWFKLARNAVLACLAVVPLTGCAGGFDLDKAGVDNTLTTSSVAGGARPQPDAMQVSDETTIRNAVSSADLAAVGESGLPWANVETGSRGAITNLVEYDNKGLLCRKFSASRESFNGVRLYAGDACRAGDGSWRMLAFVES